MRRIPPLLLLASLTAALAAGLAGCGSRFELPTENRNRSIPTDKSYAFMAAWSGMSGIQDILLTQGGGAQLFLLFNQGGSGTGSRGEVHAYARLRPTGPQAPLPGIEFPTLFNPVALCAGGDGRGSAGNRIYVLDRGDTCLARANPATAACEDTTGAWSRRVRFLDLYWRVREFGLLGGDTLTTFTDTSLAYVSGIAADAQGRVYVSGAAIVLVPDILDDRIKTRTFQWRINRYLRGPKYAGVQDPYMPGCDWHRDTTWLVAEGSGLGTAADPRGIYWGAAPGGALYSADVGKNWVQKLSDAASNTGYFYLDGSQTGLTFSRAGDVVADPQGFLYVADAGNERVLRYDGAGDIVQPVSQVQPVNREGPPLQDPVAVAADDSLVFVGDRGAGLVLRYQRRK